MKWDIAQKKVSSFLRSGYDELKKQKVVNINHSFPTKPGTYIFIKERKIIYAGEASELKRRMYRHKKRTEVSTLRKSIGFVVFKQAKSGMFSKQIENRINNYIANLKIKYIEVQYGRKELEEYIINIEKPIHNKVFKGPRSV
ncbi:MAG: GIY-YIG nuclease family protein [Candidatus Omnitrophica bacterium]|nr:GIY-YIG nuclease family protein [Candidatus Omnitrophota bacterium]